MILADLPQKHFGAILADPPWAFMTYGGAQVARGPRGVQPYLPMTMEDLTALPVGDCAAPDCSLFLWIVWPSLPQALDLIESWGFQYKTCAFAWLKCDPYRLFCLEEDVRMGLGYWTRANSEVCLLATRGNPKRLDKGIRQGILEPIREHSRKPDCVHDRIERLVVGPYLELFARAPRLGWTVWGNETTKFAGAAA